MSFYGIAAKAQSADATAQSSTSSASLDSLQDIVVTAQRREERLQSVPITVTVLSGDLAAKNGVANTSDLNSAVPNLEMSQQQNGSTPFIRGVGSPLVAQGNEPSVATYVDGVYYPSAVSAWFDFNNIERVEVLAGPQGTLFGRNATGGVIQIITKDPTQAVHGEATVGYANFDTATATGYFTGGITDNLAADLAFSVRNQGNGWGKDIPTGREAYKRDETALRTKWLWSRDETEIRATADYDVTRSDLGIAAALLPEATGLDGVSKDPGFFNTLTDPNNKYTIHQSGGTLNIGHTFGWGGKFVSITAYRRITGFSIFDEDATSAPILEPMIWQDESTWTQEMQLLSSPQSKIQWTTGVYFFDDKASYDPLAITGAALGGLPYLDYNTESKTRSYSAYEQTTIPVIEDGKITLGARYTTDKRSIIGSNEFGGSFTGYADPTTGALTPGEYSAEKRFSKFTYKAGFDYDFTSDVMGYVSASRGFKSGIFNPIQFTTPAVRPEVLDAYEAGVKTSFLDRKLIVNLSGYFYDYKDIQLYTSISGAVVTYNATSARIKGFDLQFTATPFRQFFLNGGISFIDGHYGAFPNAPISMPNPAGGNIVTSGSASGNKTIHSPPWKAVLAATYSVPVSIGKVEMTASESYEDGFFWEPENRTRQNPYSLVNASLALASDSDSWRVALWAKNLANEHYYLFVTSGNDGDLGAPAAPRTYGITVSTKF